MGSSFFYAYVALHTVTVVTGFATLRIAWTIPTTSTAGVRR